MITVRALPTREVHRYRDRVVSGTAEVEDERDGSVHALSARLVNGDESALEEVYDRWSALVHTFALKALNDAGDAEEVTQQVFMAAWRGRHTLTPSPAALPAWLLGIARHKIADVRAARAREARRVVAVATAPEIAAADPRAGDPDASIAESLVIRQALEELPDPRRTILFLAFWEDLTHAEIATSTGLPLGTIKSHVRRGLIHLRQQLEGVRHESR